MGKDRKSKKGRQEEDFGEEGVDSEQIPHEDGPDISQTSANKRRKGKRKDEETDEVTQKVDELSLDNSSSRQKSKSSNKKGDKKTENAIKVKEMESEDDEKETKKSNKKTKKLGKKGKADEDDDDDDEDSVVDNYSKSNKKKGRRTKDDTDDDDEIKEESKHSKKKQKGKKGTVDSDEEEELVPKEQKTNKKTRKGKEEVSINEQDEVSVKDSKLSGKRNKENTIKSNVVLSDDDGDSQKLSSKKKNKKDTKKSHEIESDDDTTKHVKPKSVFELLDVEDVDMGGSDEEDSVSKSVSKASSKEKKQASEEQDEPSVDKSKEGGKKSKKKEKRKKQDEDDDELQKMLEELALEIEGKKPPPTTEKEKEGTPDTVEKEAKVEEQEKATKQKKKKKKKDEADVQLDEKDTGDVESVAEGEKEQGIKTAAQKKKEKKEREKQKKLAQNAQDRKKTAKEVSEESVSDVQSKSSETKLDDTEVTAVPDESAAAMDEGDEDADSKKKKKKKKKGEEEEKKDKKRPGKKQILAMQEHLKKIQEEEERMRLEEEAKRLAAEEAERKRQEQLRLEQERKERKRQKEKERRERLRAEGKLLTKAQKQARARMEATLSALRSQGVEVPQIGEKRERVPRLGDRRRPTKKKPDEQQQEQKEMSPTEESPLQKVEVEIVGATETEEKKDEGKEESVKESWDEEEDVKEAWDETTDEEGEEDEDKESDIPEKEIVSHPSIDKKEESEESEEDEESESEEEESEEESSEESSDEEDNKKEKIKEKVYDRIQRRREEAEKKRSTDKLRSPVVCVLGHVDTGKTKILDKIRRTHVQDNEAGGITQQIGATMVPQEALKEQCKIVKNFPDMEVKLPGLLIIDTPGHESFSNLRSRGSSLCDIAILVVDIMHGLEPQTLESINLLKQKKTPFIVALNKIDRLYDWKSSKNKDIQDIIKSQARNTKIEFEERVRSVIVQFAEQGLNAALSYENKDTRTYISMVPTSAFTGEGMGNLMALIVELSQTMMAKRLAFSEELQATVLEVKAIPGLGTTIDVILVNGRLREGDTIVVAGQEGPVVTQIRSLLMPEPLKELRVKNPYNEYKEVEGAQGVKIAGKDLEKAIAGLQLLVAYHPDEVEFLKEEVANSLRDAINSIKLAERGVYVQASTLGSLEALLEFLRTSKIPYSGVRIGPVVKKDVMKASIMLEHEAQYAVILAFDVKVERDAEELADSLGVKIFQANIIYHLFDRFTAYQNELQQKKREEYRHIAVFPCKLRILPQYIFNSRDPIVIGVSVEAGVIREGTPLCVPSREFLEIGTVTTLEINHKQIDTARKGQEICIKIEPVGGESPKMYGRHFDNTDVLVSKISRQSIDACKNYFRDDLQKSDWQLMVELKKLFQIM